MIRMRTRDAAKTEAVPEAVRTTAAPNEVREARGIPAARWFVPACMATPFVFAIVVLVLMPEGARPVGARALAAAVVAAAATVTVVIARKATDRVRGAGMLIMGLAALAVTGGVVVSRVAVAVSMRELLGLLVGLAGLVLVVAGWRRLLHDIGPPWVRAVVAAVATLAVAQFVLLPAGVALDVTNRFRPAASGRTPHDLGLTYEDVRIPSTGGVAIAAWWIPGEQRGRRGRASGRRLDPGRCVGACGVRGARGLRCAAPRLAWPRRQRRPPDGVRLGC
ncbi:MAG: hypothetical protein ACXWZF_10640 [Actinomycetota bacterium]